MPDRLSRPAVHRIEEAHARLRQARKQLAPTDPEVVELLDGITDDVEELVRMLEAMEADDEYWRRERPKREQHR